MLADIYMSQGNVAKARDRLEDAVRFAPQNRGLDSGSQACRAAEQATRAPPGRTGLRSAL